MSAPPQHPTSPARSAERPDPQAFAASSTGRRRPRRRSAAAPSALHVNINSLLDVLSVILVFLMKSYSANVVQIKPSPALQVPFSHASARLQESTALTITRKAIMVDDQPVLDLVDGGVPAAQRRRGGLLIEPLLAALQAQVAQQKRIAAVNKRADFKGLVTLIADRHVPYALLTQVMYTAGQAHYETFKFAAIKSDR